jgi:molybdopterin synthase catalytic subunit
MNARDASVPAPHIVAVILDGPLTRDREHAALDAAGWTPPHAREAAGGEASPLVPPARTGLVGAVVRFEGIIRRSEPREPVQAGGMERGTDDLLALDYQTYDPMAERQLLALSREVAERHALFSLAALHSRGRVAVGEASFVLIIESAHRAEALAAMTEFIDRLKQDVPIWKRPVWAAG